MVHEPETRAELEKKLHLVEADFTRHMAEFRIAIIQRKGSLESIKDLEARADELSKTPISADSISQWNRLIKECEVRSIQQNYEAALKTLEQNYYKRQQAINQHPWNKPKSIASITSEKPDKNEKRDPKSEALITLYLNTKEALDNYSRSYKYSNVPHDPDKLNASLKEVGNSWIKTYWADINKPGPFRTLAHKILTVFGLTSKEELAATPHTRSANAAHPLLKTTFNEPTASEHKPRSLRH